MHRSAEQYVTASSTTSEVSSRSVSVTSIPSTLSLKIKFEIMMRRPVSVGAPLQILKFLIIGICGGLLEIDTRFGRDSLHLELLLYFQITANKFKGQSGGQSVILGRFVHPSSGFGGFDKCQTNNPLFHPVPYVQIANRLVPSSLPFRVEYLLD